MRILELCPYSAGICGVWSRVREEAKRLVNREGNDVRVFSSNLVKGSGEKAQKEEVIDEFIVKRFPAIKLGGESFMYWRFTKEALAFEPDIIIAHNYRHIHTTTALKIAKILRKKGKHVKVFLVTHAPFVEGDITRSFIAKQSVRFYDRFIGRSTLNKFDKIIAISKWEIPYLLALGVQENKIEYIPNGIPEPFFTQKPSKEENKILFLGRISPKKKVETLIESIHYIKDKKIKIEIVGPREEAYFAKIRKLIIDKKLSDRVVISNAITKIDEKIRKIDSCKLFVLASRVEGMPQSLVEAMARKKIVIGSDSIAIRDLIKDNETGYLFEFDNPKSLAEKINLALKDRKDTGRKAYASVKEYDWSKIIEKIDKMIK